MGLRAPATSATAPTSTPRAPSASLYLGPAASSPSALSSRARRPRRARPLTTFAALPPGTPRGGGPGPSSARRARSPASSTQAQLPARRPSRPSPPGGRRTTASVTASPTPSTASRPAPEAIPRTPLPPDAPPREVSLSSPAGGGGGGGGWGGSHSGAPSAPPAGGAPTRCRCGLICIGKNALEKNSRRRLDGDTGGTPRIPSGEGRLAFRPGRSSLAGR